MTTDIYLDEFKLFMHNLKELEVSLGSNNDRVISQGEMINRENLSKSIFFNENNSSLK